VLTALFGARLLREAGVPDDVWQPVAGTGPVVGGALIDNVDYICFTGSTRTGRLVGEQAGRRLIGASLELGGKNPMLVLRDADVERAAEGAVRACFSSSGQLCVSIERMFVADEVYDRFVGRFVARVKAMRIAADFSFDTDMGSLISPAQLATVTTHVDDAVRGGATVLAGGRSRPDVGPLFYEPTVLCDVTPGMTCFAEETFGPVVSLYRFTDEADAWPVPTRAATAQRQHLLARREPGTPASRPGSRAARQHQRGLLGVVRQHRQPDGRHAELRDRPPSGPEGIHRYTEPQTGRGAARPADRRTARGWATQTYANVMTATMRLLKRLGRP
jgi:succinate-semialdehyde dehydrogenase/glutarate-semialdehyde dehydrogenase